MDTKSLAVGAILFGLLAIGGTLDGARRKVAAQPDWVAFNWKSMLKGIAAWLAVGVLAVVGGIATLILA